MKRINIIRGLPGSGKSTLANRLSPEYIAEADQFFLREEGYVFEPHLISRAHEYCYAKVLRWMELQISEISVANTFSRSWEYNPYIRLANEHGYTTVIYHCQSQFGNIHNVPDVIIQRMRSRWEHLI